MRTLLIKRGLAPAILVLGLGATGAEAFVAKPAAVEAGGIGLLLTPAAMCGYTCRGGGRYIPGPPSVCLENGMSFCGPSRSGPPRVLEERRYEERPSWRDGDRRGGGCRTITIERDDGSIRRVRRCD